MRAAGECYDAILLLLDQQREQLTTERQLWRDRYELAQGKSTDEQANESLKAVTESLANLEDWSQAWEHRFSACRTSRSTRLMAAINRARGRRGRGGTGRSVP